MNNNAANKSFRVCLDKAAVVNFFIQSAKERLSPRLRRPATSFSLRKREALITLFLAQPPTLVIAVAYGGPCRLTGEGLSVLPKFNLISDL
jgi:hypothetical protein